jgi:hypothetical protein
VLTSMLGKTNPEDTPYARPVTLLKVLPGEGPPNDYQGPSRTTQRPFFLGGLPVCWVGPPQAGLTTPGGPSGGNAEATNLLLAVRADEVPDEVHRPGRIVGCHHVGSPQNHISDGVGAVDRPETGAKPSSWA